MKNILTQLEIKVITKVANCQDECNYTCFSALAITNEEKGALGSLVKKGLVWDCSDYGAYEQKQSPMMVLTDKGFDACSELKIDTSHIEMFD
jgi:hypothetical protein